MAELRILQKKLQSIKALRDIVDAMRNLAATYVRRAERTVEAIRPYAAEVETALEVVLDSMGMDALAPAQDATTISVVFASDQGLCGAYNNRIVERALRFVHETPATPRVIGIGRRGCGLLSLRGVEPVLGLEAPTSLEGIKGQVLDLAATVLRAYQEQKADRLFFIYNAYRGMGRFEETVRRVLPPTRSDIESSKPRTFRVTPILSAPPRELLGRFAEEHFFIEFYRGLLESHASENGARLAAMTAASTNIDDRLEQLTREFQTVRQDSITAELLDVVAGAEALR